MAGVFIDIPGVGNVEAKNAATEATLREILKAMQGVQKNTGSGSSGSSASSSGASTGAGTGAAAGSSTFFSKAASGAGKAANALGKAAGMAAGGIGKVATGAGYVAGKLVDLAERGVDAADKLSKIDGSAASAVDVLGMIPGVGGVLVKVFGAVAGAADKMVKAYGEATASGATFGGSIRSFSASATQAGMNLQEFGALIARNGQAMGAFGVTTEDGAKNFARVSKQLRATGSDLYALGYSTQEINAGLANYGKILRTQGAQGTQTNAQLAAGAKNYLKEMDMLAKVTGEERAAKEKEREALAADGQFRAAMAGLGPEVEASAMSLIQSMPSKEMQDFAKDLIANGTATTEANRNLLAQMPQLGAQFTKLHQQTQRGVAVSKDQMNQTMNIGRLEGPAALKRIKTAAAADEGLRTTAATLGSWNKVNKDAIKTGLEQQNSTAKNTDGFNEKMQKMSEVLNGVSNTFTELLASSGILDIMIEAVQVIAELAMTVLAPAFRALEVALKPVFEIIKSVIRPVFAVLGAVLEKVVYGLQLLFAPVIEKISKVTEGVSAKLEDFKGAIEFVDNILNEVFGVAGSIVGGVMFAFEGLWNAASKLLEPIQGLWNSITGLFGSVNDLSGGTETLQTIFLEIGQVVGEAFGILGAIVGTVIDGLSWFFDTIKNVINNTEWLRKTFTFLGEVIGDSWRTFRKYFSIDGMKAIWEGIVEGFDQLIDDILHLIPNALGGMSDEEYEEKKKLRAERARARDERLESNVKEKDAKVAAQKAEIAESKRQFSERKLYAEANNKLAKKELGAREAAEKAAEKLLDYGSGPEELLKQFSAKEGGIVEMGVKKKEAIGEKAAADKELAEAKTTAEKKAAIEKVEAAEKKIAALEKAIELSKKGEAAPKAQSKEAAKQGEATKKEVEAKGEEKAAAEKKAQQEAEAKKAAEEKAKEEEKKKPTTQESAETLLAQLNTHMARLIKLSEQTTTNTYEQVVATKGLSQDLYKAL